MSSIGCVSCSTNVMAAMCPAAANLMGVNGANAGSNASGGATGAIGGAAKGFMQAIEQALTQSGVGAAGSNYGAPANAGAVTSGQSPQAAMRSFMTNLVGAMHQAGISGGGQQSASADIQSLLQQLSSGTANGANGSSLSNLQSSFQNLVSALGGASSNSNTPNLQSFLQNLMQNIGGSGQSSGVLVNTSA